MKKILLFSLLLGGCYGTATSEVNLDCIRMDSYVQKMRAGQTTRQEDHACLEANRNAFWSLNATFNNADPPADVKSALAAAAGK